MLRRSFLGRVLLGAATYLGLTGAPAVALPAKRRQDPELPPPFSIGGGRWSFFFKPEFIPFAALPAKLWVWKCKITLYDHVALCGRDFTVTFFSQEQCDRAKRAVELLAALLRHDPADGPMYTDERAQNISDKIEYYRRTDSEVRELLATIVDTVERGISTLSPSLDELEKRVQLLTAWNCDPLGSILVCRLVRLRCLAMPWPVWTKRG